jgi:hypothetical protein
MQGPAGPKGDSVDLDRLQELENRISELEKRLATPG